MFPVPAPRWVGAISDTRSNTGGGIFRSPDSNPPEA